MDGAAPSPNLASSLILLLKIFHWKFLATGLYIKGPG
jgi:hypothetical protein